MGGSHFDLLARAVGRRGVLAAALAVAGGATGRRPAAAGLGIPPCAERGATARCRRGGQCCSGTCKKKRGKRRGKCRCSPLRQPCGRHRDCCGHRAGDGLTPQCGQQPSSPASTVCCKATGGACATGADCCAPLVCNPANFCDIPT